MASKLPTVLLFVAALVPSATLAWSWRDMPNLGLHHDDTLYLVGAKSLAEGNGYRIESLPGQPFQTKYPPVLPFLLSYIWKFGPAFPQNLKVFTLFSWLMLPVYLLSVRAVFRHFGYQTGEAWLLTFVAVLHPLVLLLGVSIMADLLFAAFFLACLLFGERALDPSRPAWLALAAGLLGGMAYLTRTSAFPILFTAPLCFLFRRQWRRALLFFASMLPAIVGWQVWTSAHMLRTSDPNLVYYTSYLGMELLTVRAGNLVSVLWHNFGWLLQAIAKLLVFDVIPVHPHVREVIAIAALAGAVRLVKRTGYIQYAAAAAGLLLILFGYHFPADERMLLPLYPLVLMGIWTEARNFGSAVRAAWDKRRAAERIAAALAGSALVALAGLVVVSFVLGDAVLLTRLRATCQAQRVGYLPAYDWIRARTPPGATIYAYDDPLLYLYTGRHALGMPSPPGRLYQGDASSQARQFALSVPQKARAYHLDYLLVTREDFYREGIQGLVWQAAARDPKLRKEYAGDGVAVYGWAVTAAP